LNFNGSLAVLAPLDALVPGFSLLSLFAVLLIKQQ
jgi:hypothetical protein